MPDILISRVSKFGTRHISADTPAGKKWIIVFTAFSGSEINPYVTISAEHTEDFIEELEKSDVTYEIE